jgi:predicted lysophospholipase L1 biosynthesis ABC-type transport system permease subunit
MKRGAVPAAVVSASFWRKQLSSDPSALGASLAIAGRLFTVVGVMPPAFDREEAIWIAWNPIWEALRPGSFRVIGRLQNGVAPTDAASEVAALATRLHAEGRVRGDGGMTIQSMSDSAASPGAGRLWVLAALVGAVLLVGLGNLTSLFLSRAERRKGHLAVAISLGASAWQVRRTFLLEGLLLGLAGAAVGLIAATWLREVASWITGGGVGAVSVEPGAGAALVGVGAAVLATTLLSLMAVRRVDSADTSTLLKNGAHTSTANRSERAARHALVAAQVAGCIVLTVTATTLGLAYRSFTTARLGSASLLL